MLSQQYKEILNKTPRRTNECWLGNVLSENTIFVFGHKFLVPLKDESLRIWQLMDGRRTMMEIVDQLNNEYRSTNKNVILENTIDYVLKLEKLGLAAWSSRPLFEEVKLDD